MTPMKFLPIEEFEKRQKSIDPNNQLAITSSMMAKFGFQVIKSVYYFWLALENQNQKANIIENKKKAIELKEKGNNAFDWEVYKVAEKYYSDGLKLNLDSRHGIHIPLDTSPAWNQYDPCERPLWTNRAMCRNKMGKYEDALADCISALSLDPKCTKSITQKGNALMGLGQFDEAEECYESLRSIGKTASADCYLKKLYETKENKSKTYCTKQAAKPKKKNKKNRNRK